MHNIRTSAAGIIIFLLVVFYPAIGSAQYTGVEIGLNLGAGMPQGEFAENVENNGWGGSIYGGYHLPNSPIMIGVEIGYLIYGTEARLEPFSSTIPDVTVRVENTNNIFLGHLFVRVQPNNASVKPFVDALFGFKNLYTETKITGEDFDDDTIAKSTNSSDYAMSYGIGGGLKVQVYKREATEKKKKLAVFIDFSGKYLLGRTAEYLKEGSITRTPEGEVFYDFYESKTDLFMLTIGVSVLF